MRGGGKSVATAIENNEKNWSRAFHHPPLRLTNHTRSRQPRARQLQQPILTKSCTFYLKSAARHHAPPVTLVCSRLGSKNKITPVVTTTGSVQHTSSSPHPPSPSPPPSSSSGTERRFVLLAHAEDLDSSSRAGCVEACVFESMKSVVGTPSRLETPLSYAVSSAHLTSFRHDSASRAA